MKEILIRFLIELNDKGLINNHDFDYEEVAHNFANKDENKVLTICNSTPTAFEKNNLPLATRYSYCKGVEIYQKIQSYELGIINKTDFITEVNAIENIYK